jgi:hypothetical protein
MPRGALSWARLMASRKTVIWDDGINLRVEGGCNWIYMHILAIYMHICHIHAYTSIDLGRVHIHAYMCIYFVTDRASRQGEHHTCIYVQIHAYTYKYMHIVVVAKYCLCSYMFIYVDHDKIFIHILAYTCIYCLQELTDP